MPTSPPLLRPVDAPETPGEELADAGLGSSPHPPSVHAAMKGIMRRPAKAGQLIENLAGLLGTFKDRGLRRTSL
jgi:hypothetical protein